MRASARRAADAWADHDGWFPSSKGDEAAFLALVESRGCPPAKRLEAWAAWARNEPTELLMEVGGDAALETQISKDVKRTLRGTPLLPGRRRRHVSGGLPADARGRGHECWLRPGHELRRGVLPAGRARRRRRRRGPGADVSSTTPRAPTMPSGRSPGCVEATTSTASRRCTATSACSHHLLSEHLPEIAAHLEKVRAEAMTYAPRFLMALFLHMLPGHVVARLLDCVLAASAVDPAGASDSTSAVLVHTLLAVVATAKDELVATDDFCAAQGALVRAARNTPSFEKLRRRAPCSVEACRAALTRPVPPPQAPPAPPTPQRLFPLPPPPPAAPPTGILQNLRSWFENDEYATDTMRRPRLSPRPRRSARRSAGVELSTFARSAASPVRFALEALSPAPVRGENPLSRWV